MRVGHGIDIHAYIKGRKLLLGGIQIPYDRGLDGHSDADCLLHAVIDALLGASGGSDIGVRFPNNQSQWKDAESTKLLALVWAELSTAGWEFINMDASILAQEPKLQPFIPAMRSKIAAILNCDVGRIAIKATTTEGLGYVGRGEGVEAHCVVLLSKATGA
ncbi:MAG: 2-C-methyl-D-erythritol 2,4-cyclodiphosphate synthase [Oligoflexia bacterium]|nr:2-C-methyl-D-erythritol 2,4-cyclodiphosphate synthase [Oligoflexia bacterium]